MVGPGLHERRRSRLLGFLLSAAPGQKGDGSMKSNDSWPSLRATRRAALGLGLLAWPGAASSPTENRRRVRGPQDARPGTCRVARGPDGRGDGAGEPSHPRLGPELAEGRIAQEIRGRRLGQAVRGRTGSSGGPLADQCQGQGEPATSCLQSRYLADLHRIPRPCSESTRRRTECPGAIVPFTTCPIRVTLHSHAIHQRVPP